LARVTLRREQAPDVGRNGTYYGVLDLATIFGVEDAERDDGEPAAERTNGKRSDASKISQARGPTYPSTPTAPNTTNTRCCNSTESSMRPALMRP